jgi:hypothetical protein
MAITKQRVSVLGRRVAKEGFRLLWITLVFIFLLSYRVAWSGSPISGIYTGDFIYWVYGASYGEITGVFAIFVPNKGSAIIATFPSPSIDAFSSESATVIRGVSIETDGTFAAVIPGDSCHVGQFTEDGVSGDYNRWLGDPVPEGSCTGEDWGDFSGTRLSNTGILASAAGFYEGTISGEVNLSGEHWAEISGNLVVMLSGNGTAFIAVDACALHGPVCTVIDDGGVIGVLEDGTITGVLSTGTTISGLLDLSEIGTSGCCSAQGTFYAASGGYVSSGTWSINQEIPLAENRSSTTAPSWLHLILD